MTKLNDKIQTQWQCFGNGCDWNSSQHLQNKIHFWRVSNIPKIKWILAHCFKASLAFFEKSLFASGQNDQCPLLSLIFWALNLFREDCQIMNKYAEQILSNEFMSCDFANLLFYDLTSTSLYLMNKLLILLNKLFEMLQTNHYLKVFQGTDENWDFFALLLNTTSLDVNWYFIYT